MKFLPGKGVCVCHVKSRVLVPELENVACTQVWE